MSLVAKTGARLMRSRTLMRAPIWIYRARAGAVFGSRMLMLEHIGRKSGTPRNAVLEVVDHPAPDTYVIASGFGKNSQWYRNIVANPGFGFTSAATAPHPPPHAFSNKPKPTRR